MVELLKPNISMEDSLKKKTTSFAVSILSIGSSPTACRTDNDIKNYWNTKLKKKLISKAQNSLSPIGSRMTKRCERHGNFEQSSLERLPLQYATPKTKQI
ncbi:transcription factor RAX3 [Artemisia annua]|uniref:Transcription factor RAX3 n=1 Tax=Artemisia annua TaxID=35608 RepID=A0A2U1N1Y6_ARTAN|nr:transcription factor RAX3 [Artemisia annua]